jgi:hypothetical protein
MLAMKPASQKNTPVTDNPLSYSGYRFPPDVLFMHCRYHTDAKQKRALRTQAFETWESVTCAPMLERLAA